eukprot:2767724-Rhodomonas_salina.1
MASQASTGPRASRSVPPYWDNVSCYRGTIWLCHVRVWCGQGPPGPEGPAGPGLYHTLSPYAICLRLATASLYLPMISPYACLCCLCVYVRYLPKLPATVSRAFLRYLSTTHIANTTRLRYCTDLRPYCGVRAVLSPGMAVPGLSPQEVLGAEEAPKALGIAEQSYAISGTGTALCRPTISLVPTSRGMLVRVCYATPGTDVARSGTRTVATYAHSREARGHVFNPRGGNGGQVRVAQMANHIRELTHTVSHLRESNARLRTRDQQAHVPTGFGMPAPYQ